MKIRKEFRDESRKNYGCDVEGAEGLSLERLNTGSLMRIADSLEKMEQPFTRLLDEIEYFRRRNKALNADIEFLRRSNAALKGQITKLKKKLRI